MTATILVVDDEPDFLFLLRMTFEQEGHRVIEAPHGLAALASVRDSRPDLVITDLMMPVMSGQELIRRLRADESVAAIPIIVASANPNGTVGADALVRKPVRPKELIRLASALLERSRNSGPHREAD